MNACNRHPSYEPSPSWLLTSHTTLNSSRNVWGAVTAYNWRCDHARPISENIPKFVQKYLYFHYKIWLSWSRSPDDMWPAWSMTILRGQLKQFLELSDRITIDLTFHYGVKFNIGCNVNTTRSKMLPEKIESFSK